MLTRPNRSLLCGVLCVVLAQAGCSAKRPLASTGPSFRLQSLNGESLLLTPAIPGSQASNAAITVTFASGSMAPTFRVTCSAERGPFRVEQGKNGQSSIEIQLPAPEQWLSDLEGRTEPESGEEVSALDAILADVDRLQQEGCFGETAISIRDFILQSIPMRPNESFYNAYGYRAGRSGLDLKPGIRLKIERAFFRPPRAGEEEHEEKDFLGLSTSYFDVELTAENKIRFLQVGDIRYSPASLAQSDQEGSSDLALSGLPLESSYRLFFYTYFVPEKHKRSAVIIGGESASQLDELDHQLRAMPEQGCKNTAASAVTCMEFDGFVALSSQIKVELNGNTKFLEWGAKVKDVLPKNSGVKALRSLRMQRRYLDTYYEVRFDLKDLNVLSLWLVGGDRLTWSK
jgi:hypothetical protein